MQYIQVYNGRKSRSKISHPGHRPLPATFLSGVPIYSLQPTSLLCTLAPYPGEPRKSANHQPLDFVLLHFIIVINLIHPTIPPILIRWRLFDKIYALQQSIDKLRRIERRWKRIILFWRLSFTIETGENAHNSAISTWIPAVSLLYCSYQYPIIWCS